MVHRGSAYPQHTNMNHLDRGGDIQSGEDGLRPGTGNNTSVVSEGVIAPDTCRPMDWSGLIRCGIPNHVKSKVQAPISGGHRRKSRDPNHQVDRG